jgi:hypothetical protein
LGHWTASKCTTDIVDAVSTDEDHGISWFARRRVRGTKGIRGGQQIAIVSPGTGQRRCIKTGQDPPARCSSVDSPRSADEQDPRFRAGPLRQAREDIGVNSSASDGVDPPWTWVLEE